MRLDYSEGYYSLSFFRINISTKEELSDCTLEKNKATFVHEFIHYLQDLVLPYCIRYNLTNVRMFYDILDHAHTNGRIDRPFTEWSNESTILSTQLTRTFGGSTISQFINRVLKIETVKSDYEIVSGFDSHLNIAREHRVYKYLMFVYDERYQPQAYHLGARDLLEYIAYKIEVKNFPDRPIAPQLPYESIDLIFDQCGLSSVPDDIRLCIAERCLYNDAPIHFLFSILLDDNEFKQKILNSSYEDIYDYLLKLRTVSRDGYSESLHSKSQRRLTQFANELQIQYSGFDEVIKWIQKVNCYAERYLFGRFIFSDLYKMENDTFLEFINDAIRRIGIPLVFNSNKEYISIYSNENETLQFIQFYTLQNFISFVRSNELKCPIYEFCKANCGNCNNNCTITNTEKTIAGNEKCFFRKFLDTYGLLGVKFF